MVRYSRMLEDTEAVVLALHLRLVSSAVDNGDRIVGSLAYQTLMTSRLHHRPAKKNKKKEETWSAWQPSIVVVVTVISIPRRGQPHPIARRSQQELSQPCFELVRSRFELMGPQLERAGSLPQPARTQARLPW
jgi:hypothetical protein